MEIIILIVTLGFIYLLIRNNKVFEFRMYILNLIDSKCHDMIKNGVSYSNTADLWKMFRDVSYEKMLFSFKPLKMEYWFTDEELKLLGYETNKK